MKTACSPTELERVLAAIPIAILVVNLQGDVRYVNDAALALLGRTREDFVGGRLAFSVHDGVVSDVTIARHGDRRVCEMRVADIQWGVERALLASLRDVTEQRKMETQLALSDRMISIGILAASVTHEINNPLTSTIGNLELAVNDVCALARTLPIPAQIIEELRDAREAADRVRNIVRDLKTFSRTEADKRELVDLQRVIESTVRIAWNEVRHRARLVKDYGDVRTVDANEARLGQVLLNLLVNAAQAIPEGDQRNNEIRITTRRIESGRVEISVSDTGSGMTPEVQERIFTAFFTTKPVGVGTGLGLAISRRIVTGFGGEIGFQSEVGVGTTFKIRLNAGDEEPVTTLPPVSASRATCRGRVLVIDDEALVGKMLKRMLSSEHEVVALTSASEALALFQRGERFDVILCDVMMPQMSGMDFHAAVRADWPDRTESIILLTGGAFTPAARAFLDSVPNLRVEKPFDARQLQTLVNARIRQKMGASAARQ